VRWISIIACGCATHVVLHAEPVVQRAACDPNHVAVYGILPDTDRCDVDVTALGDGCYVAVRPDEHPWNRQLFECNANGPASRVACIEDPIGPRVPPLDADDIVQWGYFAQIDHDQSEMITGDRCKLRFYGWDDSHGPPLPPAKVEAYDSERTHSAIATLHVNGRELRRWYNEELDAYVCPDRVILIDDDSPPQVAADLRDLIARATGPVTECRRVEYLLRLL